ncbi:MAG: signal peptidase I [Herpetosiphon sp.]
MEHDTQPALLPAADEPTWQAMETADTRESTMGSSLSELIETVIFILLVFFIVRGLVQNFRIEGESMMGNLHDKQYILVNKIVFFHFDSNAPLRLLPGNHSLPKRLVYPFRMPKRGDIVVLEAPVSEYESQKDYIKRVIGLPGETIQVKNGNVFINGEQLDEPYLTKSTDCGPANSANPGLCQAYTVPPDSVVVMGDNRTNSQDSRSWPALPALGLERIVGKAWISYWPQSDWGVIPSPAYAHDARP